MNKKLIVLDPGMRQHAGHYYEYNMALKNVAELQDYAAHIFASREWVGSEDFITPYFVTNVGQGNKLHGMGHKILAAMPPFLRRQLFVPARMMYRILQKGLAQEHPFMQEVAGLPLPDDAIILCPSASYKDILSLMPLCSVSKAQWRFVLRQKPQEKSEEEALNKLGQTEVPENVKILVDTYDLGQWLKEQNVKTALMPIPMQPPEFVFENPQVHDVFTFAMLGPARMEKGIALLPDLIAGFESELKKNQVRFFIQTTLLAGQAPEPETERAIAKLKKLQKILPNIELQDGDLTEEDFYRALCGMSCLLVPYDRKRYEARSSGLLVQAFLCGRPAIVPAQTWMADQMPVFLKDFVWENDLEATCRNAMQADISMGGFTANWRLVHSPQGTFQAIISGGPSL